MTERDLEKACIGVIKHALPGAYVWKIHDLVTGGQPDLEVNWNGATTKIEFKVLKRDESIHQKWEDARQLITCVRYEVQTGRCWVVAYRKGDRRVNRPDATFIYRPTRLLDGKVPTPFKWEFSGHVGYRFSDRLWQCGVVQLPGFAHDAVAAIIRQTHL